MECVSRSPYDDVHLMISEDRPLADAHGVKCNVKIKSAGVVPSIQPSATSEGWCERCRVGGN